MRYQPSNWVTPHFIEWITGLELTKSNQYNVEQDRLKVNFIIIYTYIKNVKKKWWLIPLFSLLLNPPQSFSKNPRNISTNDIRQKSITNFKKIFMFFNNYILTE